jgi:hypothetical protein
VACGTGTCQQINFPGFDIPPPCCFNAPNRVCGTLNDDDECVGPPEIDERCPSAQLFGDTLDPCCIGNQCGVDSSEVGMGCVPLSNPQFRMIATNPPEPMACDGGEMDAGD